MEEEKSFIHILFDISFQEIITLKIIKFLYLLGILFSGISAFYLIVQGFSNSFFTGFLALVFSPIVFFLYVILSRVFLEIIWSVFKIAENTQAIANQYKSNDSIIESDQ